MAASNTEAVDIYPRGGSPLGGTAFARHEILSCEDLGFSDLWVSYDECENDYRMGYE